MAFALLQSNSVNTPGAPPGPKTLAFPGACTPGSLIVLTVCYDNQLGTVAVTSVGDTVNTYTRIGTAQVDAANGQDCTSFYAINSSSSTLTVTLTTSGSVWGAVTFCIAEFSGVLNATPLDTSDTTKAFAATSTSTDAETSSNITPAAVGELIVAFLNVTGGVVTPVTPGTNFSDAITELGSAGHTGTSAIEYRTGPAGSQNATFTVGTAGKNYTVQIAAFNAGTVAVSTVPNLIVNQGNRW